MAKEYVDSNGNVYTDDNEDGVDDLTSTKIPVGAIPVERQPADQPVPVPSNSLPPQQTKPAPKNPEVQTQTRALGVPDDAGTGWSADSALSEQDAAAGGTGYANGQQSPNQYGSDVPVIVETGRNPNFGKNPKYSGGTPTAAHEKETTTRVDSYANLSWQGYWGQDKPTQDLIVGATKGMYGNVGPSYFNSVWKDALQFAAARGVSIQQQLKDMASDPRGYGSKGAGGGTGGPFQQKTTQINLTDPGEADRIVSGTLAKSLGRSATDAEKSQFLKALNTLETENPTVQVTKGNRSGNNTTQSTKISGGFDSANFADEWARSRGDYAEYQAATTYMDAFDNVIQKLEF